MVTSSHYAPPAHAEAGPLAAAREAADGPQVTGAAAATQTAVVKTPAARKTQRTLTSVSLSAAVYIQYGLTLFNRVLSVWDHAVQLCTVSMGSRCSTVYCQYGITLFNCVLSIWGHTIQLSMCCKYGSTLFNCVLRIWDQAIQLCTVNTGSHYSTVCCKYGITLFNCVL